MNSSPGRRQRAGWCGSWHGCPRPASGFGQVGAPLGQAGTGACRSPAPSWVAPEPERGGNGGTRPLRPTPGPKPAPSAPGVHPAVPTAPSQGTWSPRGHATSTLGWQNWVLPAPYHPQGHASCLPALPAQRDLCGVGIPPSVAGRREEVRMEERAINKCKYSKKAPGQSCEGHRSVCQQISNPHPHWHLTKCHCE